MLVVIIVTQRLMRLSDGYSPGGVLVEELPPLALVRLLDRDPHRRLPHALPGGQVGEHVLLQQMMLLYYCDCITSRSSNDGRYSIHDVAELIHSTKTIGTHKFIPNHTD